MELKFRARIKMVDGKPAKKGVVWVYINGVGHDEWYHANGRYYGEICEETCTQYIGLKDKNGKEIYKGDIISCLHGILRVDWDYDASFSFRYPDLTGKTKEASDGYNGNLAYADKTLEIIGNVYENNELIKS